MSLRHMGPWMEDPSIDGDELMARRDAATDVLERLGMSFDEATYDSDGEDVMYVTAPITGVVDSEKALKKLEEKARRRLRKVKGFHSLELRWDEDEYQEATLGVKVPSAKSEGADYDDLESIGEALEHLAGLLTEATLKRKPKHYKTNKRFKWSDKSIPAGARWVTIRGSRVLLNRDGKAILPRGLAKKLGSRKKG